MYIINFVSDRTKVNESRVFVCYIHTLKRRIRRRNSCAKQSVLNLCVNIKHRIQKNKCFGGIRNISRKLLNCFKHLNSRTHYGQQWKWWSLCGGKNYTKKIQKGNINMNIEHQIIWSINLMESEVQLFMFSVSYTIYRYLTSGALSPSLIDKMFLDQNHCFFGWFCWKNRVFGMCNAALVAE